MFCKRFSAHESQSVYSLNFPCLNICLEKSSEGSTDRQWVVLKPQESAPFAWEEPLQEQLLEVEFGHVTPSTERCGLICCNAWCEDDSKKALQDHQRQVVVKVQVIRAVGLKGADSLLGPSKIDSFAVRQRFDMLLCLLQFPPPF